ncbi:uncharacterized protein METZ01_LOCUS396932, partial [marine metagenome]
MEESLEGHGGGFFKAEIQRHSSRRRLALAICFFLSFQPQQIPM